MSIIGLLPITLTNGQIADATQVMADLNQIVNNVNANSAALNGSNAFQAGTTQTIGGDVILTATASQQVTGKYGPNLWSITASIVSLRALAIATSSPTALVMGYYAPGDGGGGFYRADLTDTTSSDNGGTIIVATDLTRWKLMFQGSVYVEQFGACASQADNTASLNAASTWAGTFVQNTIGTGYGSIVTCALAIGPHVIPFSGTWAWGEGVMARGTSRSSSVLKWTGTTGTAIQCGDTTTVNGTAFKANVVAQDFCLYQVTPNSGSIGFSFVNTVRQCEFKGMMVFGFGKNVTSSNNALYSFLTDDSYINNAVVNNIYVQTCNTLTFRNLRCETAGGDNIVIDGGTNSNQPLDIAFHTCVVQGAKLNGVKCIDAYQVSFYDCDMEGNNLIAGGTNSDIFLTQGAQNNTCQVFRIKGGFYSAGHSPNTTHRIVDAANLVYFMAEGVLSSGGDNNYDVGFRLASTVQFADIGPCSLGGCNTDVAYLGTTIIRRFDQQGNIVFGNGRAAAAGFDVQRSKPNGNTANIENTSSTSGSVALQLKAATNDTATYQVFGLGAGVNTYRQYGNGNVQNANNSYGAISDAKLKNVIGPAASSWDDFKAYEFVKYTLKADLTNLVQIGVIAQQIRPISPGLVGESEDFTVSEDGTRIPTGTTTLDVKYSVLYLKACVVLREAMLRIEALEKKA